jgi:hypothetical protein
MCIMYKKCQHFVWTWTLRLRLNIIAHATCVNVGQQKISCSIVSEKYACKFARQLRPKLIHRICPPAPRGRSTGCVGRRPTTRRRWSARSRTRNGRSAMPGRRRSTLQVKKAFHSTSDFLFHHKYNRHYLPKS